MYNPYTGSILEYHRNFTVLRLIKKILSLRNLRVIRLKQSEINKPVVKEFIEDVRKNFMGDLINVVNSKSKPIQMPPIVKIKRDVKYLKSQSKRSVGEGVLQYLSELSIYINNKCSQGCNICNEAYKQFHCCSARSTNHQELDFELLSQLFKETENCNLSVINIIGGDIFTYPAFSQLVQQLNLLPAQKNYYANYLNIARKSSMVTKIIGDNISINVFVTLPPDKKKLLGAIEAVGTINSKYCFTFIVESEDDFMNSQDIINTFSISNVEFKAFYNGDNLKFFKENIYIDRKDIEENKPSLKDIYTRESINSLFFGSLTILPNRRIYANVNAPSLGILKKDSIYEVLIKEMSHNRSWRKIRKNVLPCKSCTFRGLCPPISNYNYAIGKYNLCHIKQEE